MDMKTLKDRLSVWHDWDGACFELAVCLGLMPDDDKFFSTGAKHIFWTDNPTGNALYMMLMELVRIRVLLMSDDKLAFCWNQEFKGDW
jgi:hypothetical protein